jgi:hypothetical protein
MQDQMRQHNDPNYSASQPQSGKSTKQKKPEAGKVGDYIDFEEVKD